MKIAVIGGTGLMGDASDPANPDFALSGFDNALWQKIDAVIN